MNDDIPRGAGDPDFYGYPGEKDVAEVKALLNDVDHGYVGLTTPKVEVVIEDADRYLNQRWAAAKKLGVSPADLEDEPDEMADHSDDQDYEPWKEEE